MGEKGFEARHPTPSPMAKMELPYNAFFRTNGIIRTGQYHTDNMFLCGGGK